MIFIMHSVQNAINPYEFLGCSRKRTIENWNRYMEKRYDADDDL